MSNIYDKSSLVLIPSGTKTGKVFSQKPVSGDGDFTFTRSSAATRVNADGNIEKETGNLLLQSNQFDTTWINVGSTLTSGQSGYNGNNAWKVEASSGVQRIEQTLSSQGVATYSMYAKAGNVSLLRVQTQTAGTDVFFDLSNGTITIQEAAAFDATITDAGNGWYRCTMSVNETISNLRFLVQRSAFSVTIGDFLYVQDAQLEQSLVARDYQETTTAAVYGGITDNVPRLDYTDSSCPALLLEPLRTNRFAHSEYSGGFNSGPAVNVTNNQAISPEGLQNAFKIEKTSNNYAYLRTGLAATTGCLSVFAKKGNYRYIGLRNNQINGTHSTFDFDTETFVVVASGQTCTFEDYGNGWYRLTAYQPNNEGSIYQGIAIVTEDGAELLNSSIPNGSHFFVYGLQNEAGSYATSYIPTYGSSVSRVAETNSVTGISDLIGQSEGVIYWEGSVPTADQNANLCQFNNDTNSSIVLEKRSNGKIRARIWNSGSAIVNIESSSYGDENLKIAFAYASGDIVLYINGTQIATNSTTFTFAQSLSEFQLGVGVLFFAYPRTSKAKQSLLFKTRLTNAELAALTTI